MSFFTGRPRLSISTHHPQRWWVEIVEIILLLATVGFCLGIFVIIGG